MKIALIGTGYVGLVSGVGFAEMGNSVVCVDVDPKKLERLKRGECPIYEPGLEELLKRNLKEGRISFTDNLKAAVEASEILFFAVQTPPGEDGSADLSYVLNAARDVARLMPSYRLLVTKSTVPVGTNHKVKEVVSRELQSRNVTFGFDVASNPEFLKEGAAVPDFMKPDRIILGTESPKALQILQQLYEPFMKNGHPVLAMDLRSAEMTKYAANAMLATKISFMNELSRLCEDLGADIETVRKGIGTDPRIGPKFIYAGIGYGGSCFPKDVQAVEAMGRSVKRTMKILHAVEQVNREQSEFFSEKILRRFGPSLSGRTFAVWGLTFKPDTDDLREAPALRIIDTLIGAGAQVKAYDPTAGDHVKRLLKKPEGFALAPTPYEALPKADALILATEWKPFREPDWAVIKSSLKQPVIFDGRNIWDPENLKGLGFELHGLGRKPA